MNDAYKPLQARKHQPKRQNVNTEKRYYVYALSIPRGGDVFYIGKGTKNRIGDHAKEASQGTRTVKCAVIRHCSRQFSRIDYRLIHQTDDEAEAYFLEMRTITSYPYGFLTNILTIVQEQLRSLLGEEWNRYPFERLLLREYDDLVVDAFLQRQQELKETHEIPVIV